jgi:transcriptional regulator GlxA family with amidase domain
MAHCPSFVAATGSRTGAIERALRHIEQNFCERLQLAELAAIAQLSVFRFATVFRQHVGVPPYRYIRNLRVLRAKALLRAGLPPAIAAGEAGFYDQSHLSRHFKIVCGMTPGQYVSRMRGGIESETRRPASRVRRLEVRA